jgi:ketosteroid isomerase-like protein
MDETARVVTAFGEVLNSGDIDAIMQMVTDDILFETTRPPDGERFEGKAAVRKAMEDFLANSRKPHFETEEVVAFGDRAFARWRYTWENPDGSRGHVRGVDLNRVRDGKIAETIAYVKG